MKIRLILVAAFMYLGLTACDDTTDTLGDSLTHTADKFQLLTDTFGVSTRSMTIDSVLASSIYPYIGHVKDSETGSYIESSFSSQLSVLQTIFYSSPKEDSIKCEKDEWGNYIADKCYIGIYFNSFKGDTLNTMKLTLHELAKPLEEGVKYYSNFDLAKEGYLRNDGNEIKLAKSYTYEGLVTTDSMRPVIIDLNKEEVYVDMNGNKYKNYGSYLLTSFYKHPEYFSSSYNFIHKVCPGFYFEHTNGMGNMGEVAFVNLAVGFKALRGDSLSAVEITFPGTEEVMQTSFIDNDKDRLNELASDESCTYVKSPSGIFTEMTLPIDSIKRGHENDTISSAKVIVPRYNYTSDESMFSAPNYIMMVPKDSLYSFFENKNVPDSKMSYLASYSSKNNTYTFNNISDLVNKLWQNKVNGYGGKDWNKVVLLPVTVSTNSSTSSSTTSVTNVTNEMGLKSTKLVRGTNFFGRDGKDANGNHVKASPLKISVIYNKFRKE